MMKVIIKPSSFRYASKFRDKPIPAEISLLRETLGQDRPLSVGEWNELRDKVLSLKRTRINKVNIDAIILELCNRLDVGKSYMNYLKQSEIEPNASSFLKLLNLYYKASQAGTEITSNDQQDIIDMLVILMKLVPKTFLNKVTFTGINGFSKNSLSLTRP